MSDRFVTSYTEGTAYPSGRHQERMSRKNHITVCVPVYNGEKNLLRCLNSVKKQLDSYTDFELIIVDNVSTDKTFDIALKFVEENPWATLYKNDVNVGRTNNWNVGLELSLDSDYHKPIMVNDYLLKDCLKVMAEFLDANPKAVIMHVTQKGYVDIHTLPYGPGPVVSDPKVVAMNFLAHNVASGPTTYIHAMKQIKENNLRYRAEMPIAGDYELMAKLSSYGEFIFSKDELVFFDEHEPSRTHFSVYLQAGRELESLKEECICRITPFTEGHYDREDVDLLACSLTMMFLHLRHKAGISKPVNVAEDVLKECLDLFIPLLKGKSNELVSEILEAIPLRFQEYILDKLGFEVLHYKHKENLFLAAPAFQDNNYSYLGKNIGLKFSDKINLKFSANEQLKYSEIITENELNQLVKSAHIPMGVKETTSFQIAVPTAYQRLSVRNIGYFSWETNRLAKQFNGYITNLDLIVVPNEFCKNILLNEGFPEERIFVWPTAVDTSIMNPEVKPLEKFGDKFNVLCITGLSPRSGVEDLVESYLSAFKGNSKVRLIIAPREEEYSVEQLGSKIKNLRQIYQNTESEISLIKKTLPDAAKAALMKDCHLFVSAFKGEGTDHNLFNAAAVGLPIIITGWGGPAAEFTEEEVTFIDYELTDFSAPANNHFLQLVGQEKGQKWASPDKIHLYDLLTDAFENYEKYKRKADVLASRMKNRDWSTALQSLHEKITQL